MIFLRSCWRTECSFLNLKQLSMSTAYMSPLTQTINLGVSERSGQEAGELSEAIPPAASAQLAVERALFLLLHQSSTRTSSKPSLQPRSYLKMNQPQVEHVQLTQIRRGPVCEGHASGFWISAGAACTGRDSVFNMLQPKPLTAVYTVENIKDTLNATKFQRYVEIDTVNTSQIRRSLLMMSGFLQRRRSFY